MVVKYGADNDKRSLPAKLQQVCKMINEKFVIYCRKNKNQLSHCNRQFCICSWEEIYIQSLEKRLSKDEKWSFVQDICKPEIVVIFLYYCRIEKLDYKYSENYRLGLYQKNKISVEKGGFGWDCRYNYIKK